MLERHKVPYLVTDRDVGTVVRWRDRGRAIFYGDASNPLFLVGFHVKSACRCRFFMSVSCSAHPYLSEQHLTRFEPQVVLPSSARSTFFALPYRPSGPSQPPNLRPIRSFKAGKDFPSDAGLLPSICPNLFHQDRALLPSGADIQRRKGLCAGGDSLPPLI